MVRERLSTRIRHNVKHQPSNQTLCQCVWMNTIRSHKVEVIWKALRWPWPLSMMSVFFSQWQILKVVTSPSKMVMVGPWQSNGCPAGRRRSTAGQNRQWPGMGMTSLLRLSLKERCGTWKQLDDSWKTFIHYPVSRYCCILISFLQAFGPRFALVCFR